MITEATFWRDLQPNLKPFGAALRCEHRFEQGWPDVSYCLRRPAQTRAVSGWCELKHMDALPARGGPVKIPRFYGDDHGRLQVLWAERWHAAGGHAGLLLKAGHTVIAVPVPHMGGLQSGLLDVAALREVAGVWADGRGRWGRVVAWLTRDDP